MGPVISSRSDATSLGYMKGWVEGTAHQGAPVFADVRDVARAHILAAETPAASGRYIVANSHSTPGVLISAWLQVGPRLALQRCVRAGDRVDVCSGTGLHPKVASNERGTS